MTKAELIKLMEKCPDDANILISLKGDESFVTGDYRINYFDYNGTYTIRLMLKQNDTK